MIHLTSQCKIHAVIYRVIWWTIQNTINIAIQSTITEAIHSQDDAKFDSTEAVAWRWFVKKRYS